MKFKANPGKSRFLETDIEKVCGNDDLRPNLQCVYFKDGYVYATNAHVAIKQKLFLHQIDEEVSNHLDGKMLHKSHLKLMKKCDYFEIAPNGLKSRKGLTTIIHEFTEGKYPDVESVIPKESEFQLSHIGLNSDLLKIVQDAFIHEGENHLRLHFTGKNKAVLVTSAIYSLSEQVGVVMPTHTNY